MMRHVVVLALLGAFAFAQAPQAAPSAPKPHTAAPAAPAAAAVPETAPVITIDVTCSPKLAPMGTPGTCKKTVTRAEFERLLNAVAPDLPAAVHRQVAMQYAQMLAVVEQARAKGLENDPKVQEQFKFSRLNVLAKFYVQELQKKAEDIPAPQIQAYYDANKDKFEAAKVQRLYIPKPFGKDATPEQQKAVEELAQKIHDRAAAGEDPAKLETEAFDQVLALSPISDADKKSYKAPTVDLGEIRRGRLPQEHDAKVFDLNPGQVSAVITAPSGYFIYKLVSKEPVALDQAREEIKQMMARQRFQQQIQEIEGSAHPVLNDAYFGPEEKPSPAGAPNKPQAPPSEAAPKK
jgi:hypothetical protein